MHTYQRQFIQFAIEHHVLMFGKFQLKSGRTSPYFFNTGLFNTGNTLAQLGDFYTQAIVHNNLQFDSLFGPAYKGIPLVSSVAIALAQRHGQDLPYSFNRKEAKNHGDGGILVGAPLEGRTLIVDDVITAGLTLNQAITFIQNYGAQVSAIVVALDRQEPSKPSTDSPSQTTALSTLEQSHNIPIVPIISRQDIITYLKEQPGNTYSKAITAMEAYCLSLT